MSEQVQVAPVATNTPFAYSEDLVISVGVSDMESAIEWYKDVLGLELVYKLDQHGWCEMSTATKHLTIGLGQTEEVKGRGVVGKQPTLAPGESFEYTSGCPLKTPSGVMRGTYQMVTADGDHFDVEIAPFSLDEPYTIH